MAFASQTEPEQLLDAAFATYKEIDNLGNVTYPNEIPAGFKKSDIPAYTIEDNKLGLYVTTFVNDDTSEAIIAFCGSEMEINDWVNNANRGWPQYGTHKNGIQDLLKSLIEKEGYKVNITGHSLGGALAQFAAYDYAVENKNASQNITLTTFNSLGGKWALEVNRTDYAKKVATVMNGISATHYYRYDDFVSQLGEGHVGGQAVRLFGSLSDLRPNKSFDVAHQKPALEVGLSELNRAEKIPPNYFHVHDVSQSVLADFVNGLSHKLQIAQAGDFSKLLGEGLGELVKVSPLNLPDIVDGVKTKIIVTADLSELAGIFLGRADIQEKLNEKSTGFINVITSYIKAFEDITVDAVLESFVIAKFVGQLIIVVADKVSDITVAVVSALADTVVNGIEFAGSVINELIRLEIYIADQLIKAFTQAVVDKYNDTVQVAKFVGDVIDYLVGQGTEEEATVLLNSAMEIIAEKYPETAKFAAITVDVVSQLDNKGVSDANVLIESVSHVAAELITEAAELTNYVNAVVEGLTQQTTARAEELYQSVTEAITKGVTDTAFVAKVIADSSVQLINNGIANLVDMERAIAKGVGNAISDTATGIYIVKTTIDKFTEAGIYGSLKFIADPVNVLGDFYGDLIGLFDRATQVQPPVMLIDPIIIDLDGDSLIELIARETNNVFFDMDGDGLKEWTGWVNKDDAFLAIDENNNGVIDSIKELIGEQNTSGFTELKTYDSNGDKVLDSKDSLWTKIKVWQDINTNGLTDVGELKTLAAAAIKAIDLNYTDLRLEMLGNQIHETSVFFSD